MTSRSRNWSWFFGLGCLLLVLIACAAAVFFVVAVLPAQRGLGLPFATPQPTARATQLPTRTATPAPGQTAVVPPSPTLPLGTPVPTLAVPGGGQGQQGGGPLTDLYAQVNPGVVNIQVTVQRFGQAGRGAGSGFIIDDQGHIVTNNHVVEGASSVIVVFWDGLEAEATVVGTDPDSDLAVVRVDELPEGTHPLPLGDSDAVQVGETVIAIGNPFGLGSSMTAGIVSALHRTIESGATPFSIPQAIQTDAAINPGNSGGPLINMAGQVIGVNAQIATGGTIAANAGVGFAIPSNVVRRVAPALIQNGRFVWPYMGITGGSVNLQIAQANNLPNSRGAYVDSVTAGSPSDRAGLRGSTSSTTINGIEVPVGGDVIIEAGGVQIRSFDDLLVQVSSRNPGDALELTLLRNGREMQVTVTLEPRP